MDVTYVAYYGGRERIQWMQGAPGDKGYKWRHEFAAAVIVGENAQYVVSIYPLEVLNTLVLTSMREKTGPITVDDVARRLQSIADQYENIREMYADRGSTLWMAFTRRNNEI